MSVRILLDPQGGEGNGAAAAAAPAESQGDKAFETLLSEFKNDGIALARELKSELGREGKKYRDRIKELKDKLPPEGSRTLSGDDGRLYDAYRALGTPEDLRRAIDEGQQTKADVDRFRRADLVTKAAKLHGFDADVLGTLAEKLEITIGEVKGKDGKAVPAALVKGEGDRTTPLNEYAEAEWGKFLPSLKAEAPAAHTRPGSPRPAPQPATPQVAQTQPTARRPMAIV